MSNLSLAEAVKLKSVLAKRIHELEEEMDRVAFVEMEKGSKKPKQARSLSKVEEEIDDIRKDFRLLDKLMYQANFKNKVSFNGEELAIVEAIELATQLRAKARKFKEFGSSAKEDLQFGYGEGVPVIRKAMFDPEEYRVKAVEQERLANRLSNAINTKNYSIVLDFDSDKYF
ncbi:hypothetical protein A1A1_17135 [Planococcus antarcticus DSM 14505]|uniref:Uncharacterized protein n=1 Tax=Planococcus antarcticus DSM 14505 TaxID=1185653 RepID=A0A1C7DK68_9BACL|nr:hypothetical protein [Planococcus antarcticus]ANU11906.1 hypothetical protein BBH88_17445 [Planococcus antarcticus DSM 14505]EIM05274.1 hypothetical protein A1A1_17135 [Planococcus antarcticus DSM 14505]